ncbi:MAG TPA: hypothetical protein VFQ59_03410 [Candidatus Paceibacterota bacterium]|nr:hypothetical protein [Candidatus Paceibacterota bacterium]
MKSSNLLYAFRMLGFWAVVIFLLIMTSQGKNISQMLFGSESTLDYDAYGDSHIYNIGYMANIVNVEESDDSQIVYIAYTVWLGENESFDLRLQSSDISKHWTFKELDGRTGTIQFSLPRENTGIISFEIEMYGDNPQQYLGLFNIGREGEYEEKDSEEVPEYPEEWVKGKKT